MLCGIETLIEFFDLSHILKQWKLKKSSILSLVYTNFIKQIILFVSSLDKYIVYIINKIITFYKI